MVVIHQISDFKYFSNKQTLGSKYPDVHKALRAHIKYITRKDPNVVAFNLEPEKWLKWSKDEVSKRWDSRVALKFNISLPVDATKDNVEFFKDVLLNFLSETLNVPKEHIGIAFHFHKSITGTYNPHAHILIYPRDFQGKKLRKNKKDLKEFHRKWDKTLESLGYKVRREKEEAKISMLKGLHHNSSAQELYAMKKELQHLFKVCELSEKYSQERGREEEREKIETLKVEEPPLKWKLKETIMERTSANAQKETTLKFLNALGYKDEDTICILLVNHQENKAEQKFIKVKQLRDDRFLSFLRFKNANGYSVYISVNTLKDNAKNRKKESFREKQKRIYLDLDAKGVPPSEMVKRLWSFLKLHNLPNPTLITRSSKGNYQVYWLLDEEVDYKILEGIMERINTELELDPTQDVARVFRLAGFRNKKPSRDNEVVTIVNELTLKTPALSKEKIVSTFKPASFESFRKLIELEFPNGNKFKIISLTEEEEREEERREITKQVKPLVKPKVEKPKAVKPLVKPKPQVNHTSLKHNDFTVFAEYLKKATPKMKEYFTVLLMGALQSWGRDEEIFNILKRAAKNNYNASPSNFEASVIMQALNKDLHKEVSPVFKKPYPIVIREMLTDFVKATNDFRKKNIEYYINLTFKNVIDRYVNSLPLPEEDKNQLRKALYEYYGVNPPSQGAEEREKLERKGKIIRFKPKL